MKNKLSKRLQCIADLVDGRRIIDVGCDHGKVVNYLLCNSIVDYAICSDISAFSCDKARILLEQNQVPTSQYSIRVGDGLECLTREDNIDLAIITGMGGVEICNIISHTNILPDTLILGPQKNIDQVKKKILDMCYHIVFDKIIYDDGKFYTIFVAKKSDCKQDLSEFDILFGKDNFVTKTQDFARYLSYSKHKYANLVAKCNRQEYKSMLEYLTIAEKKLGECNEEYIRLSEY